MLDDLGEVRLERPGLNRVSRETLPVSGRDGRVWCLEIRDAAEDHAVQLHDIPNIFAAAPEQLLAPLW